MLRRTIGRERISSKSGLSPRFYFRSNRTETTKANELTRVYVRTYGRLHGSA